MKEKRTLKVEEGRLGGWGAHFMTIMEQKRQGEERRHGPGTGAE
jgi:hypothetical protein